MILRLTRGGGVENSTARRVYSAEAAEINKRVSPHTLARLGSMRTVTKRLGPPGGVYFNVPVIYLSVMRTLLIFPASIICWNWLYGIVSTCWLSIHQL